MAASLSVVIITKNEERNIQRCLDSVQGVADEIIVVDSHSTDSTPQICAKVPGLRFEQRAWQGYSVTKNYANSLATGSFILSLDADEALSPELKAEILSWKQSSFPGDAVIFRINRLTNYCGRWIYHCGWTPDFQTRLFPQGQGHWNKAEVHESLEFSNQLKKVSFKGYLYHYSYYSISEHVERVNLYSSLGAQKISRKGRKFLLLRAVGHSATRFFKAFFIKRGFLDGWAGLVISVISGYAVFLKYVKAYELQVQQES